jgi:hypothetical protein
MLPLDAQTLALDFCGEEVIIPVDRPFVLGRDADFVVDDNPYLHRRFIEIVHHEPMWWIGNIGTQLSATISDGHGRLQAWLAPGARMPIVFETTVIRFTAGSTCYEINLTLSEPTFTSPTSSPEDADGTTTIGRVMLTPEQRLLVVALAEPALIENRATPMGLPASAEAAQRLGWAITKFNRKLDNVCAKLTKAGVRGLHGGPGQLASSRRARLVEYALAVRLVTEDDLVLLDRSSVSAFDDDDIAMPDTGNDRS